MLVALARRGPRPDRGPARRRQDDAGARASRARSTSQFARVQCTADLLPADVVGHERLQPARGPLRVPARARSSPTSCSSTRSTAPRPRRSPACSSACRSAASRSTCTRTSSRGRSSCWPRRTRSSSRAPTRCPRRRSTASWCALSLGYPSAAGRGRDARAPTRAATASSELEPVATRRRGAGRAGRRHAACTPPTRCAPTSSRCCGRTRDDARVELGASPRAGLHAAARRQGARAARAAATTRCPTTSRRCAARCSPTASCSRPRRSTSPASSVVADALAATPAL